jgi:hypothetical protein
MRFAAMALLALLATSPAMAQTVPPPPPPPPPPIDPRLVLPTLNAVSGMLTLREAELKTLTADAEAREATWVEWYKALQAEHGAK